MNASEQIAAINRKRIDEHRRVDMQHDQLIQQVRERCVHDTGGPMPRFLKVHYNGKYIGPAFPRFECIHCGQSMPGSE